MIDYEVLRFIWWLLVGVLLIGFAVTDGFDMGVGMLTRFLGRNDTERRIMINSIACPSSYPSSQDAIYPPPHQKRHNR